MSWIQLVYGLGSSIVGAYANKKMRDSERKTSQKESQGYNLENMEKQREHAYGFWKDTAAPAQVEQLEEAGLSKALMYGGAGGAGGQTVTPNGGSPNSQSGSYDIASNVAQLGIMKAQKEALEAQAEKARAEADKTKGVDTAEAEARTLSLAEGINNQKAQQVLTKAQTQMQEVQNEIAEAGKEVEVQKVFWSGRQALNALQQAENETYISNETYKEKVEQIRKQTILMSLEAEAKKAGITLTQEQTRNIGEQIRLQEGSLDVQAFKAEIEARYPSIWNAIGGRIDGAIDGAIDATTGGKVIWKPQDKKVQQKKW